MTSVRLLQVSDSNQNQSSSIVSGLIIDFQGLGVANQASMKSLSEHVYEAFEDEEELADSFQTGAVIRQRPQFTRIPKHDVFEDVAFMVAEHLINV